MTIIHFFVWPNIPFSMRTLNSNEQQLIGFRWRNINRWRKLPHFCSSIHWQPSAHISDSSLYIYCFACLIVIYIFHFSFLLNRKTLSTMIDGELMASIWKFVHQSGRDFGGYSSAYRKENSWTISISTFSTKYSHTVSIGRFEVWPQHPVAVRGIFFTIPSVA